MTPDWNVLAWCAGAIVIAGLVMWLLAKVLGWVLGAGMRGGE